MGLLGMCIYLEFSRWWLMVGGGGTCARIGVY
jgi:hypothetical protein